MESFRSSDAYHEQAHLHFAEGRLDEAVTLLSEGLERYPDAVELHVGLGCAQLAREEYAWAHRAFQAALWLDPEHEDALLGTGETFLLLGQPTAALQQLHHLLALGFAVDHELMLGAGRVLARHGHLHEARRFFDIAYREHSDSPEAAGALGAVDHQLGHEAEALYWLRRALEIDGTYTDARIYLANMLYDRGEVGAALLHFLRTHPEDHTDLLGVTRIVTLLRQGGDGPDVAAVLAPWLTRHGLLTAALDDDPFLAELEARVPTPSHTDPQQLDLFTTRPLERVGPGVRPRGETRHMIETLGGMTLAGTWEDLVAQLQLLDGAWARDTLAEFMAACARRGMAETGVTIPLTSAEAFLRGAAAAGVIRLVP